MKQNACGRKNVLDEQTRVLALQLLDGNLHFLRRQLSTENGRGRQVPSVARVASDEEVVPIEEAEGGETTKMICAAEDGVGGKENDLVPDWKETTRTRRRYARPDQLIHSAPLVCCVSWRYERGI